MPAPSQGHGRKHIGRAAGDTHIFRSVPWLLNLPTVEAPYVSSLRISLPQG